MSNQLLSIDSLLTYLSFPSHVMLSENTRFSDFEKVASGYETLLFVSCNKTMLYIIIIFQSNIWFILKHVTDVTQFHDLQGRTKRQKNPPELCSSIYEVCLTITVLIVRIVYSILLYRYYYTL